MKMNKRLSNRQKENMAKVNAILEQQGETSVDELAEKLNYTKIKMYTLLNVMTYYYLIYEDRKGGKRYVGLMEKV